MTLPVSHPDSAAQFSAGRCHTHHIAMTSRFLVRRATRRDLRDLTSLFEGYRAFYHRDPAAGRARRFLGARLGAGDSLIWVARERMGTRRSVGFVQVYPTWSSLQMVRAWILNDLFVDPDVRRYGVGRLLMRAVSSAARRSQVAYVELATQRANHSAQALYQSEGYVQDTEFEHWALEL
jgi:ribosomal protein S18 acetylase RimI-like enzyme